MSALFAYKDGIYELQEWSSDYRYSPELTEEWHGSEQCYIRFGRLPSAGRSMNNLTEKEEAGVSVWEGRRMGNKVLAVLPNLRGSTFVDFFHMWFENLPVYAVEGRVLRKKGGDGEPLLADAEAIEQVSYEGRY